MGQAFRARQAESKGTPASTILLPRQFVRNCGTKLLIGQRLQSRFLFHRTTS